MDVVNTFFPTYEYPLPSPVQIWNTCAEVSLMCLFSESTFHSSSLIWMEVGHINSPCQLGYKLYPAGIRDLPWLWGSPSSFGSIPRHKFLVFFGIWQECLVKNRGAFPDESHVLRLSTWKIHKTELIYFLCTLDCLNVSLMMSLLVFRMTFIPSALG